MGNVYDENTQSAHGPAGNVKQNRPGPYGGKNNAKQASIQFPGEKPVTPVPKPK
ncbi:hypothetical protein [Lucifera butyrica]|uniref:hypothetical protein n=1 Tax=Lucifera butyrica TaxID=1351585 RepID=UPI0014025DD2|nr:hypothetical protein [Lucifera butyrica]